MGKFLFMMSYLVSSSPTYQVAGDNARRALLETDMMKLELQEITEIAERNLNRYTGLKKENFAYVGYAYPLFSGKLSSKPFKEFKYQTEKGWLFLPEVEYGIWDQSYSTHLIILKEF